MTTSGGALVLCLLAAFVMPACSGRRVARVYKGLRNQLILHTDGTASYFVRTKDIDCFYTLNDRTISLKCLGAEPADITVNDDGSIADPYIGGLMNRVE